ncbi:Exodeoxyribonuclease 7 large subunit [Koleobacter methoxysyntrophicus]|jgi:exodeoxyribonuclease VII large subunit|uniref:Exodeoxyribonuclease 7 large subunit n=2 Tax=Koleobacter methoxysyntrophicus TaxID=2751313 RepID=A0A8A0RR97_9FIRM|nr:exodeoxyribonuclease VII large subunit [Koleobacter methoxysyntrophicus]MDI3540782.1 exodeoxyribonuclease large subunit [Thermosediminibacterales bacterium]MDK2901436.1 exodeoxyribonuclease large subunit [Thermosediminibacterales bacterium]QSQ10048.1 Exodeoxyribonuclease 7 large subunit [Koleobacter methoxysyntrophicus]
MGMTVLTVGEVTKYIKQTFVSDPILNNVYVKGEVSNYIKHTSGHMYFTLKDKTSKLKCVMFSNRNRLINFSISNGMKVIVGGYISVYERDGIYQLYAEEIQPDGIGSLYLAFEELKQKLEKEGLFKPEHKKKIPALPRNIGLVTSTTGAAVRDFLTVVKRRFPGVNIYLVPVLVQGVQASEQISNAIDTLNRYSNIDLIVLTRGGGSIEELWAFNEERVARSIFSSKIPIVSAVGHERDFTIADFVADLRAPTPSAAGELVVPVKRELEVKINTLLRQLNFQIGRKIISNKEKLSYLKKRLYSRPEDFIYQKQQEIDNITKDLFRNLKSLLERKNSLFMRLVEKMEALSPLKVLSRGYSITRKYNDKTIIKDIKALKKGEILETLLYKGQILSQIIKLEEGRTEYGN